MQNDSPSNGSSSHDEPENEITDDDLFRQQMQGVAPLKPDNKVNFKNPKKRPPVRHTEDDLPVDDNRFSMSLPESEVPEILNFERAGVQSNTLKKLRRGKLPIDNSIDLHGMTVEQARRYLLEFLAECEQHGARTVIIVHGKGYRSKDRVPVIKTMLNKWLRESQQVLAFHSALPKDGGTGAVYVLLRKS